jgi:nuclear pore complex protein Nup205
MFGFFSPVQPDLQHSVQLPPARPDLMSQSNTDLTWSTELLKECYRSIQVDGAVTPGCLEALKSDLLALLTVPQPKEGDKLPEEVEFADGRFKLNSKFVEAATVLSLELSLAVEATAELLHHAGQFSYQTGVEFVDSGRAAFHLRLHYILNIFGYLVQTRQLEVIVAEPSQHAQLFANLVASFEALYRRIGILNDLIEKEKTVGNINDLKFILSLQYSKQEAFQHHELLGSIYYSLVAQYPKFYATTAHHLKVVGLVSTHLQDNDVMTLHYLPGLLQFLTSIGADAPVVVADADVEEYHKHITNALRQDHAKVAVGGADEVLDLSKTTLQPLQTMLMLVGLTFFISWCKVDDKRTSKYDFQEDILKYIDWTISYGAFEKLLCIAADTTASSVPLVAYDFRSLLQGTIPSLAAIKLAYKGSAELLTLAQTRADLNNVPLLTKTTQFQVAPDFRNNLIAPLSHAIFKRFITNLAVVLTLLRDSEEDFLLSTATRRDEEVKEEEKSRAADNENAITSSDYNAMDLDEIAHRSDLERFYLAMAYTYQARPELCDLFWSGQDGANEALGFISWGLTNNTSPLITATFSILVGSLTFGLNANKVWEILVNNNGTSMKKHDFSKVSVDSIWESLHYYVESLSSNFKDDLQAQQQQQQRFKFQDYIMPSSTSAAGNSNTAFSSLGETDAETKEPIVIELSEDSVVFIAGFVQLLACVAKNLCTNGDVRSRGIKTMMFKRFHPIICKFLKFDNVLTSEKGALNTYGRSGPPIYINEDNRVVLINVMLDFLEGFVDGDLELRYQVWDVVDRWIFNGGWPVAEGLENEVKQNYLVSKPQLATPSTSYKSVRIVQHFHNSFTHFSQIVNFSQLLGKLLEPTAQEVKAFKRYRLLYPADLGSEYRLIGVWPYIEFILTEVFAKSANIADSVERLSIQVPILQMVLKSMNEMNWKFLNDIAPLVIKKPQLNLDACIDDPSIDYDTFVKLHHSLACFNYMFNEKVYKVFFKIIDNVEPGEKEDEDKLLQVTLKVIERLLEVQDTFISKLVPKLRNGDVTERNNRAGDQGKNAVGYSAFAGFGTNMSIVLSSPKTVFDNIYYPKDIGLQGVTDFYEIFTFNLPVVAKLGLLVASPTLSITSACLHILKMVSQSSAFTNSSDALLNKNRLLTTFETVNESETIKYAFMQQLERPINGPEDLTIKADVLLFLLVNIDGLQPSLTHFLLGYKINTAKILLLDGESAQNTLLKTLMWLLNSSLDSISNIDYRHGNIRTIDLAPAKLASLTLEILVRLCKEKISSRVTLEFLRECDLADGSYLFDKLIDCQPNVDMSSLWSNVKFDGDLSLSRKNTFIEGEGLMALFAFIRHRNFILEYLSLEFHSTSSQRSITRRDYYINLLLNGNTFLNGAPRILSFLDILNLGLKNLETSKYEMFDSKFNLPLILQTMKSQADENEHLSLSIMEDIFRVLCKQSSSQLHSKEQKMEFAQMVMSDGNEVTSMLIRIVTYHDFKSTQLACLHSWVQLIQVLLTDGNMSAVLRSDFVLETFQMVLPKVNDYLETDILFAEELISLCVRLFDFYEKDNLAEGDQIAGTQRLFPLFQTCINGILCSYLTPSLRSDLYVLANKFLQKPVHNDEVIKDLTISIRSVENKFIDILCNDSIYAEGAPRITSLLLLEKFVHLSSASRANFVLDALIKNNSLLLLVRSIKRTDEILSTNQDKDGSETMTGAKSLNNLLYELTAFKATLSLLLRVAASRLGASQLIQCELFPIIKSSKFLSIDPDLGLYLQLERDTPTLSENAEENIRVRLSLDTPLLLNDYSSRVRPNDISYYEFLVPVFQLVTGVLISMGPSYKPSIIQAQDLKRHFHQMFVGVLKRDALLDIKQAKSEKFGAVYAEDSISYVGLKEMVRLVVLLDSIVSVRND